MLGFYHGMATVYFSVALIVLIGWLALQPTSRRFGSEGPRLRARSCSSSSPTSACGCSAASIRATMAGLAACYVAAIPFFQNTVAGDLFYAALLFGGFALLERAGSGTAQGRGAAARLTVATFAALLVEAPLNLSPLVGNQRLTQGKIT